MLLSRNVSAGGWPRLRGSGTYRVARRAWIGGLLIVVALLAACASGRARSRPVTERTTIEVDNRAFVDMTVYVVESGGSRRRLGLATGVSTTVFTIPATLVGLGRELQFVVDPIGSDRTAISNRLYVTPGQQVTLTIPPH